MISAIAPMAECERARTLLVTPRREDFQGSHTLPPPMTRYRDAGVTGNSESIGWFA